MNVKFTKRILSGALAVALLMAPGMGVFASNNAGGSNNPGSISGNTVPGLDNQGSSTAGSTATVETFKQVQPTSTVAGVKSTVNGAYLLQKGVAVAVTTPSANISQAFGLGVGETPYVKALDMDVKKSNLAKASLDMAAAAFGGNNVGYIQMEIGKMTNGEYSLLPAEGKVSISFSIPAAAQSAGARYAVIRVVEGGAFTLLENTSTTPGVVSFTTTGGAAAYAIVKF